MTFTNRPLSNKRGVDLISDALPFGRLWYGEPKRNQHSYRIREVSQPITSRRDSRLRSSEHSAVLCPNAGQNAYQRLFRGGKRSSRRWRKAQGAQQTHD